MGLITDIKALVTSINAKIPTLSGDDVPVIAAIDQVTANANEVVVKSQTAPTTLPLPSGAATSTNQQPPSTTITEDYITISVVDTEYSKALPANCKAFSFRCVDSTKLNAGSDIRYAFTTGKVATPTLPFQMLDGGAVYSQSDLNLSSKTLYVAGITAGDIVLLEMWS